MKKYIYVIIGICMISFYGCMDNSDATKKQVTFVAMSAQLSRMIQPPQAYTYQGSKYRDPMSFETKAETQQKPSAERRYRREEAPIERGFDIAGLHLSGVIWKKVDDIDVGYATLYDDHNNTYTIRDTTLFDGRGKEVPGVTCSIQKDYVILQTSTKKVVKRMGI